MKLILGKPTPDDYKEGNLVVINAIDETTANGVSTWNQRMSHYEKIILSSNKKQTKAFLDMCLTNIIRQKNINTAEDLASVFEVRQNTKQFDLSTSAILAEMEAAYKDEEAALNAWSVKSKHMSVPLMVMVTAKWCYPCQMVKPFLEAYKSKGLLDLLYIDADTKGKNLKISRIPTGFLFKKGELLGQNHPSYLIQEHFTTQPQTEEE